MSIAQGVVLKGQIVLERELGSGGMGAVWLAQHLGLNAHVAVKVMHADARESEEALARFAREAHAIAQIDSPHVVRIYDVGSTEDGEPFLVMELLRGRDLKTHLEEHGSLALPQAQLLLSQACAALGRAHELGIVHRDIKAANLFLCEGGVDLFVKVVDFGVAKMTSADELALTSTDALMGTPYYMSPEQFVSPGTVDHRSDLWSMAVVLYAALTGQLPFLADTVGGLTLAVHKGEFVLPRSHRPDLPGPLDDWFRRALAAEREHRFQSATEMARSFAHAVAAAPATEAIAPPAQPTLAPVVKAKPPWGWLVAGILIASAVTVGGIALMSQETSEPRDDDDAASKKKSAPKSVDLAGTSVKDLYKRARREAKKKNDDVELTALSFTEVLPGGELSAEGRFKVYFNTPGWKCVTVVMTSDGVDVDVSKCAKGKKIAFPKCSIGEVMEHMKGEFPAKATNMIYTAAGKDEAQWLVSVAGQGGFVPDDC